MDPNDKIRSTPNHPAARAGRFEVQPNMAGLSPSARHWFGQTLQMERFFAGYTEAEVAEAMGMYGSHGVALVERVEAGEVELSRARAQALQDRLGIPALVLLEQVAPPITTAPAEPTPTVPVWPAADVQERADRLIATAVLAFAASMFFALGAAAGVVGGGPWGVAATVISGTALWVALSVALAAVWCRAALLAELTEER